MNKTTGGICALLLCQSVATFGATYSAPPEPEPYFSAVSPIFGYDPAYGTLLGAAWFSYPTGEVEQATDRKSLSLVMRFGPHGALSFAHEQPDFQPGFGLDYALHANNLFLYETETDSTVILDTEDQLTVSGEVRLRKPLNPSLELFTGPRLAAQWISGEQTGAAHLFAGIRWDHRDDPVNSHLGWFAESEFSWQPSTLNSDAEDNSWRVTHDLRTFLPVFPDTTLAIRGLGNVSDGPGLMTSIGGSELLRGYLGDQFQTQTLAAGQTEFRFPVWRFIRGVTFYEIARFSQGEDWRTRQSAGLGFRFGLPPDQSMSVRWDLAVNDLGQWQSFVNFNQVF